MRILVKVKNIQLLLAKRNRDYAWLSDKTGLSASYIYKVMRKEYCPSGDTRKRIQKAFGGASWDFLFEIHEEESAASESFMTATAVLVSREQKYE
jgi:hypothetical protein